MFQQFEKEKGNANSSMQITILKNQFVILILSSQQKNQSFTKPLKVSNNDSKLQIQNNKTCSFINRKASLPAFSQPKIRGGDTQQNVLNSSHILQQEILKKRSKISINQLSSKVQKEAAGTSKAKKLKIQNLVKNRNIDSQLNQSKDKDNNETAKLVKEQSDSLINEKQKSQKFCQQNNSSVQSPIQQIKNLMKKPAKKQKDQSPNPLLQKQEVKSSVILQSLLKHYMKSKNSKISRKNSKEKVVPQEKQPQIEGKSAKVLQNATKLSQIMKKFSELKSANQKVRAQMSQQRSSSTCANLPSQKQYSKQLTNLEQQLLEKGNNTPAFSFSVTLKHLTGITKMDSVFDIQNDINNLSLIREKLIDMIIEYNNQFGESPQTTLEFYKFIKMIGKGAFGKVHLAIQILTGKPVAIKCISKTQIQDLSNKKKIFNEIFLLKNIKHENIIKLLEVFSNQKYIFIVMEYAPHGDLLNYLKKKNILTEGEARPVFRQIVEGLKYCHSKNILHRDIKLDNLLISSQNRIKICDFGVSRIASQELIYELCGTPAYIAPEIINHQGYCKCYADI